MSGKKWSILLLGIMAVLLLGLGGITAIVDPYFHYHKPLDSLAYPLTNERYQNDGIVKHFTYDAIITGTSMTENFKTSEFDALFGVHSVKTAFSGASYREINENLERAIQANPEISCVVRGIDYWWLMFDKDVMFYDAYPTYLYDSYLYNDVQYLWNKDILLNETFGVLFYTKEGNQTTSYDDYGNWMGEFAFGKEAVDASYARSDTVEEMRELSESEEQGVKENVEQNIVRIAAENPNIEFYLFFTPYSIYYWDSIYRDGTIKQQLYAEKAAIEAMLPYENIHLFSFFDEFAMICNLDNYKDIGHYHAQINSQILQWMQTGEHQLTEENYLQYWENVCNFYLNYPYDRLFS